MGNLRKGIAGVFQHVPPLANAAHNQIVDGRNAVFPPERVGKVIFVHMRHLGQRVQRKGFGEMLVNIPPRGRTFRIGPVGAGGRQAQRRLAG